MEPLIPTGYVAPISNLQTPTKPMAQTTVKPMKSEFDLDKKQVFAVSAEYRMPPPKDN